MRHMVYIVMGVLLAPSTASGNEAMKQQLLRLDPTTRIEQACGFELQQRINQKEGDVHTDRVVTYTFSEPDIADKSVEASGAAIRSHGEWYRLSFSCRTDSTLINVQNLNYELGELIPRTEWEQFNLHD